VDFPIASNAWRRSSRCEGGNCLEVAETETGVGVRDSQRPEGPILRFPKREWAQFVSDVKDGSFDLPT
jgi:hypothetical protein